jgi:hypothetical protein
VLSNYLTSIADQFDVYLAFHSYSQLLLFPYGHNNDHVSNYDELVNICAVLSESLGFWTSSFVRNSKY